MLQLYSHDYVFSEEHCKSYTFIMMQIKLQISSCQSLLVRLHALKSPAGPEKMHTSYKKTKTRYIWSPSIFTKFRDSSNVMLLRLNLAS
jgi:hypothetical protein